MLSSEKTIIRDPVQGTIELTPLEARLIDTPIFQRLRFIRQLGMTHLVYPGAHHTRFEHALGSLQLAEKMARALELPAAERKRLRLAALLHDVGHLAFSHDSESVTQGRFGDHEKRGAKIIRSAPLAAIIEKEDDPAQVAKWMQGASYGQLITSDVGADRIDYLLRDAYYTGVAYGVVDGPRILSTLLWEKNKPAMRGGGLEAAESLIMARFEMFHAVYYHHAVRMARAMLQQALAEALDDSRMDWTAAQAEGDTAMLLRLHKLPAAKTLVEGLMQRRLHKRVWTQKWSELDAGERRRAKSGELAGELSEKCGCCVLVSVPDPFKSKTTMTILTPEGAQPLEKASPLVASLEKAAESRAQLLIGAPEKEREKAARIVKRMMEN